KEIRPLFQKSCYSCHSAAGKIAMGGLQLDSPEGLETGGARGPAIVAGNPSDSILLKAVRHVDETLQMPPGSKLSDAEIAHLTRWVEMGAPWGADAADTGKGGQTWWSFVPPTRPSVPQVKNSEWARSPIDAFVLAALEEKGLEPAPAAD